MDYSNLDNPQIIELLRSGQIGVLPTDTIYGIHTSVFHPESVEKIYKIIKRDLDKPLIILISSLNDLAIFKIKLDPKTYNLLGKYWPGKISIILPVKEESLKYLHRGKKSLAFRIPADPHLKNFLEKTGPLVSTSANPQGAKPAKTIEEAEKYFGDQLDFYVNAGPLESEPSTLVEIKNAQPHILREGAVKL
jgi:L-threonylcarbamoyladenylate synthase